MPTGIQLSSGVVVGQPIPLDAKFGPYNSTTAALNDIGVGLRYRGLTVGVYVSGDLDPSQSGQGPPDPVLKEYWFKDGTANGDFVAKSSDVTWDSVLNKPALPFSTYKGDYDNGALYGVGDVVSTPVGSPYGEPNQLFTRVSNPGNPGYPPGTSSGSSVYVADNDPRIANIRASSINNLNGDTNGGFAGGNGGYINLKGGDGDGGNGVVGSKGGYLKMTGSTTNNAPNGAGYIDTSAIGESDGGNIITRGGGVESANGGSINTSGGTTNFTTGGSINTYGGTNSGNGGSINTTGGSGELAHGGSINTSGGSGDAESGGSINTYGGPAGAGGSINTSNGGGSINIAGGVGGGDGVGGSITSINYGGMGGGSLIMSAGSEGNGGTIDTSDDGGSINTRAAFIQLGRSDVRTTLTGTATAARAISLPNASGTLGWLQSVSSITLSGTHQLTAARNQRLVVNNTTSAGGSLAIFYPTSGNAEGDRLEIVHASQPNGGQSISVRTGPNDYTGANSISLGYQRTFIYVSGSWIAGSIEEHTHPTPTPSFASSDFRVTEPGPFNTTNQLAFSLAGITAGSLRTLTIPNASGTIALTTHTHTAANITDSTAVGRAVLTAASEASARAAIGAASTSDVVLTGVVQLTQAQFNALTAPNATTLYINIG